MNTRLRYQGTSRLAIKAAIAASLLVVSGAPQADKLYRWVDEQGNVSFQDHPPPSEVVSFEERSLGSAGTGGVDAEAPPPVPVVVYGIDDCDACADARTYLTAKGIAFTTRDPSQDQAVAKEMVERFGKAEVPIIAVGDEIVRGHSPLWLDSVLAKAGYADTSATEAEESAAP